MTKLKQTMKQPQAIFFDLDGTIADTAPDLAGAANDMRVARKLAALPFATLRPVASAGARGLLSAAFDMQPEHAQYDDYKHEFLQRYEERMTQESTLFIGMLELLDALEERGILWGVITNKASRFAIPLCQHFGLMQRAAATVCGDTTPHTKPHPAPLLKAAELADVAPVNCWYVGDDLRDIQAARAADMGAVAASYGYCETPPATWQADHTIAKPEALLHLLKV
jgi:N-acetyl-D-muramate 6-phosphate phosphatase